MTAKPPSPVSSAAQAKASVAKPLKLLRPNHLSQRRRRRAPVVPPTATLPDVWVLRQAPAPATSPAKSPCSAESPRRVTLRQDDTDDSDDEPELIQLINQSHVSEQPKTPPKGSRPQPSLRGGEAVDRSKSERAERSPGLTGWQPAALRRRALPLPLRVGGMREDQGRTFRVRCASSPNCEPLLFGGRSKDRRDYSPRLVTPLDSIHDQGIELFLAGATERPYFSLELLLRDARRRAGQDVSSLSESMHNGDQGGGPLQGAPNRGGVNGRCGSGGQGPLTCSQK